MKCFKYSMFVAFLSLILTTSVLATSIKLFYFENGHRGWKGGNKTIEECEKSAKRNRLSPIQYYCSASQDYDKERKLGWRK